MATQTTNYGFVKPSGTEFYSREVWNNNMDMIDEVIKALEDRFSSKVKFTPEGGLAVKLVNNTGTASVKGTVVSTSTNIDDAFILQSNEYDAFGVVYENGVPNGQECWVVVSGIAQVLLEDGTAATRGYWAIAAATDGRANATQPVPIPNNTLGEHTIHFKEIGHCLQSVTAGTNKLCRMALHFN